MGGCQAGVENEQQMLRSNHRPSAPAGTGRIETATKSASFWAVFNGNSATPRSVAIAPFNRRRQMRSGWRHILRIRLTIAAKSPRSGHALFKGYETAIRAAAAPPAVICAPRIVLRLGGRSDAEDGYENLGNEERKSHGRIQSPRCRKRQPMLFVSLVRAADRGEYRQAAGALRKA
jgi:hypothetical protein